jgi:hypothetical protein
LGPKVTAGRRKHIGSSFEEFLRKEGRLEEATATARKRVAEFGRSAVRKALKRARVTEDLLGRRRGREVL